MAKQSYTKELQIKVDSREVDALKQKLDTIYVDTIKSAMTEFAKGTSKEDIQTLKELKEMLDDLAESTKPQENVSVVRKLIKDKLGDMLESIGDTLIDFFKDTFNAAKERILDMASYDLQNSLFTNSSAREQALKYGIMDPAQNYALTQAMGELGMSSEEDLMFMNPAQQEKFAERMGYWSGKYTELANKDFFRTVQEFQLEWSEFKYDMELGMIEFFMQNKDTIKQVMEVGMRFMEGTLTLLSSILDFLQISRSDSQRHAASMEIVRNYTSRTNTTNVNINNTLNPSSQVLTDKQMLSQAGQLSYAQLIEALKG